MKVRTVTKIPTPAPEQLRRIRQKMRETGLKIAVKKEEANTDATSVGVCGTVVMSPTAPRVVAVPSVAVRVSPGAPAVATAREVLGNAAVRLRSTDDR